MTVEALIALQPNELGRVCRRQRFCHFGLADARLAFEQERTPEQLHQRDRGRKFGVGDVAASPQSLRDLLAIFHRYANTPRFFAARQLRQ